MEARVDVQAVLELAAGQQALRQHGREENRQRIVVAGARNLDAHVEPGVLALALGAVCLFAAVAVAVAVAHLHVCTGLLAGHWLLARLLHLGLDADERLSAVFERNAGAAVGRGQHVILCAHGAKVAGPLGDIEADGRRLGERRAQEGQLGGREVDEGVVGGHGGVAAGRGQRERVVAAAAAAAVARHRIGNTYGKASAWRASYFARQHRRAVAVPSADRPSAVQSCRAPSPVASLSSTPPEKGCRRVCPYSGSAMTLCL